MGFLGTYAVGRESFMLFDVERSSRPLEVRKPSGQVVARYAELWQAQAFIERVRAARFGNI